MNTLCLGGCWRDETLWCVSIQVKGEQVATRTEYTDPRGARGITETLYRTPDGRLLAYSHYWTATQGEPVTYRVEEVTPDDLAAGGRFEALGRALIGDAVGQIEQAAARIRETTEALHGQASQRWATMMYGAVCAEAGARQVRAALIGEEGAEA